MLIPTSMFIPTSTVVREMRVEVLSCTMLVERKSKQTAIEDRPERFQHPLIIHLRLYNLFFRLPVDLLCLEGTKVQSESSLLSEHCCIQ